MSSSGEEYRECPDALSDDGVDARKGAYFPRRFVTDFFYFIDENSTDIEVISYADLEWGADSNYKADYPDEWSRWKKALRSGKRDPNKAYIVIQYDVDSSPERTLALLQEPAHQTVPANIMIFNKRVDRRRLKNTGELAFTDYQLDDDYLRACERRGCIIGYHTNAHEQGLFDMDKGLVHFDHDVRELSKRFLIRFFSAHGGVASPDGRNNRDLPFHPDWVDKLKWVHNGHSPYFHAQFSDGGHNSPARDPEKRDLRDFVGTFRPGGRYRILLHPQYYHANARPSKRFTGTGWYDRLLDAAKDPATISLWSDVRLGGMTETATAADVKALQARGLAHWWDLSARQKWLSFLKLVER